jgi:DtxR family Mn-dependent transcriptional regulator
LGRLSDLRVGESAVVHGLAPSCVGPERTRLLDLGVVPGTKIRCEFSSPFGSPKSYVIRGAMIGLRESQAKRILILRPAEVSSSQKA